MEIKKPRSFCVSNIAIKGIKKKILVAEGEAISQILKL